MEEYNEYNGYRHVYGLNKKTEKIHFIRSIKNSDFKEVIGELEINPNIDYYYTKNTFKTTENRGTDNVLGLNSIVIDVDLHDVKDIQKINNIVSIISYSLIEEKQFNFTRMVSTGRGLQIHIDIEQASFVLGWLYEKASRHQASILEKIIDEIKTSYQIEETIEIDMSATTNTNGLIRLPNTINTVSKTETFVIIENDLYFDLNELIDSAPAKKKEKRIYGFEENLIKSRINYIYNTHITKKGNRDKTMFLLYNNLVQVKSIEEAEKDLIRFNKVQPFPLKKNEIDSIIKYINKKGFLKFTQETFNEWLGVEEMQTRAQTREEKRKEKKLRNLEIRKKIKHTELTYLEIAKEHDVSVKTVERIAKKYGIGRYKKISP